MAVISPSLGTTARTRYSSYKVRYLIWKLRKDDLDAGTSIKDEPVSRMVLRHIGRPYKDKIKNSVAVEKKLRSDSRKARGKPPFVTKGRPPKGRPNKSNE